MRPLEAILPGLSGAAEPCKACGAAAAALGDVSFYRATGRAEARDPPAPRVQYQSCPRCGLLFTSAFDRWSPDDFKAHVYNEGYLEIDPEYVSARAERFADGIVKAFGPAKGDIRLLDYGGGNGRLAEVLRQAGFAAQTYDPFNEAFSARPAGRFNLITCFETLEHVPQPREAVADLLSFADQPAMVLFSTLLQPPEIADAGLSWWYVGPRNGHITLYTAAALGLLFAAHGMRVASGSAGVHLARSAPPPEFYWRVAERPAALAQAPAGSPEGGGGR